MQKSSQPEGRFRCVTGVGRIRVCTYWSEGLPEPYNLPTCDSAVGLSGVVESCMCPATPVLWVMDGETRFSPAAPRVLRWNLHSGEEGVGEGRKQIQILKDIKGTWFLLITTSRLQQEYHFQAFGSISLENLPTRSMGSLLTSEC